MKFLKRNGREEKPRTPNSHASGWSRIKTFTVAGLFGLLPLTSCDNNKINNEITLDRDKLYVECDILYEYSGGGSGDPTNSKNTVSFRKVGDSYVGEIFEDGWGPFNNLTSFESNNLNVVKNQVSNHLTNNTKLTKKMKESTKRKLDFTVEALDSAVNNKPLPENRDGFTIEDK